MVGLNKATLDLGSSTSILPFVDRRRKVQGLWPTWSQYYTHLRCIYQHNSLGGEVVTFTEIREGEEKNERRRKDETKNDKDT
jgi:hypothetical protein